MQWELLLAMAIAVPMALFPAAYVWYVNFGSLVQVVRRARGAGEKKTTQA